MMKVLGSALRRGRLWGKRARAALVAACVAVAACSGGGDEGVAVAPLRFVPAAVTLAPQEERSVDILGGVPPYRAQSGLRREWLDAQISGTRLVLRANPVPGQQSGTVAVTDSRGSTQSLQVTIAPLTDFEVLAPQPLVLPPQSGDFRYQIRGGQGPYRATVDNSAVVAARAEGDQLVVTPLSEGEANVVVYDHIGSPAARVTVRVGPDPRPLVLTPESLSVPLGQTGRIQISGGKPPYTVTSALPDAVAATLSGDGRHIELSAARKPAEPVDIVVRDAAGQVQTARVTVTDVVSLGLAVSPARVVLSEASPLRVPPSAPQSVSFRVSPAGSGLSAYVSNVALLTPSSSVSAAGSFTVTVNSDACVASDTEVVVTVVDEQGRSGQSIVVVTDIGNQVDADGNLVSRCPPASP